MAVSITGSALRFIFEGDPTALEFDWVDTAGVALAGDPPEVRVAVSQDAVQQWMRVVNTSDTAVTIAGVVADGTAPYQSVSLVSTLTIDGRQSATLVLEFAFDGSQTAGETVDVEIVGITGG